MPFYRVQLADPDTNLPGEYEQEDDDLVSYPFNANEIPIFLIPGILGNGFELYNLIQSLQHSTHPIFVYYDSRLKNNDASNTMGKHSLIEQAKTIANNMMHKLKKGPVPYVIAGYSFGCPLAVLAAQELQEQGQDAHLYLIDGVSPETSKEYFNKLTPDAISDLNNIVNYAARVSNLDEITISNDPTRQFQGLSFDEIIDFMSDRIHEKNLGTEDEDHKMFSTLISITKQNLHNLFNHASAPLNNLSRITALITSKTATKYADLAGGWDKYTNNLLLVNNTRLLEQEHTDLMLPNNAKILANSIKLFFKNEVISERFYEKCINFYLSQSLKNKTEDSELKDDELDTICSPEVSGSPASEMHIPNANNTAETCSENSSGNASPRSLSPSPVVGREKSNEAEKTSPKDDSATRKAHQDKTIREQFKLFVRKTPDVSHPSLEVKIEPNMDVSHSITQRH